MSAVLALLFAYLIYRHTSGKAKYNRVVVFIMCLLALLPCLIAAEIGWRQNPRRAAGDNWRTAI